MSMMSGTVQELGMKEVNTKFGVKPTFSFKANGTWVKCGFKSPMVSVGDTVEFEGTPGTYGLEGKNIKVTVRGTGEAVAAGSSAISVPSSTVAVPMARSSYGKSERVFPIPPLHGDRSIVRQNALARAVDLVIGAAGGKPFTVDETTCNLAIVFARKFEAYTAGDLDMEAAMSEEAVEVVASKIGGK